MGKWLMVVKVEEPIDEIGVLRLEGLKVRINVIKCVEGTQLDVQDGVQDGMKEGSICGRNDRSVGLEGGHNQSFLWMGFKVKVEEVNIWVEGGG